MKNPVTWTKDSRFREHPPVSNGPRTVCKPITTTVLRNAAVNHCRQLSTMDTF